jgi:hydroxymethylbilane synthase
MTTAHLQPADLGVVRLGTRGSDLALWQTNYVAGLLRGAWPGLRTDVVVLSTHGDQVLDTPLPELGGKGAFTAELEAALQRGEIDVAVHSLKDLPTAATPGLTIGAIPKRAEAGDMVVTRSGVPFATLPDGSVVGTSSSRRAAQLLYRRRTLKIADIRGNVDTRLRKALDPAGPYDAVIFARAGLERLGLVPVGAEPLDLRDMLPAPGQGALAVQCREDQRAADLHLLDLLGPLDDYATRVAVSAERAFQHGLGGGCSVPVAAYARLQNGDLLLTGRVSAPDGSHEIEVTGRSEPLAAIDLGLRLAEEALSLGARDLLEEPRA